MPTRLAVQVGLLSKDNTEQIPFAYKLYKSDKSSDVALAEGFKETFSRPVPIDFVGVWWVFVTSIFEAELSARHVNMNINTEEIDRQGHGCERRNHHGPITSFCGCQHHNSGVQTSLITRRGM
jgi:hypothetical protein